MNIDDFQEVRDCIYKDEHYSVRDNGAVLRHQRVGMRKRKLDDVWSFGTPNVVNGYMDFGGERVHRIVATAFLGEAPTEQHVVDHIDTNRQNNRPDNLRWLTKLENILNNEITRKKVELICGSIEAFLENPSLLYGYETEDKNFSWMRNVTPEEAKNCLENWSHWARTAAPNPDYKKADNHVGDWIYGSTPRSNQLSSHNTEPVRGASSPTITDLQDDQSEGVTIDTNEWLAQTFGAERKEEKKEEDDDWYESSTPSAKQNWWTKTEFPCCPSEVTEDGLERYQENLKEGSVFSINTYDTYYVIKSTVVSQKQMLVVLSTNNQADGTYGTYSLACVKIEKGFFVHISLRRMGDKETATHFYKLEIGEEKWTADDEIFWDT